MLRRRDLVWAYLGVNVALALLWFAHSGRSQQGRELMKERLTFGGNLRESTAREGFWPLAALIALSIGHYVIAALDLSRFHWSDRVPLKVQAAALLGFTAAMLVELWAMSVNPFFSSAVRIQRDRGHRVITDGPYRYVRHPGYAVGLCFCTLSGLALGSWLSAAVGVPVGALLVRRTAIEDKMLLEELEGYAGYAKKVRYRLIPGLW